ncbi:MAG: hypothetical protein OSB41_12715, partial [Kiritimatiellae bacterium]|nr:hypothetical protein [Kiritimatiellia bacterium]
IQWMHVGDQFLVMNIIGKHVNVFGVIHVVVSGLLIVVERKCELAQKSSLYHHEEHEMHEGF